MIKLTKSVEPQVLAQNAKNWTDTLTQKIAKGESPTASEKSKYRHKDIKSALVTETNGKCAYCESKLLHIHHGDVEHIFPKSLDLAKTFEWENLTLACEICNQNKSDHDPYMEHIIDPYLVEPADHVVFVGSLAFSRGTVQGKSTLTLLKLNRTALAERRQEHLSKIMGLLETAMRDDLPLVTRRAIFSDVVENEASDGSAFAAMTRAILNSVSATIPAEICEAR